MLRRLLIVALFALGGVLGCSQKDEPTATADPAQDLAAAPAPAVAVDPGPPAASAVATDPSPPAATDRTGPSRIGRGFVPLYSPSFLAADQAEYLGDEELVLGVEWAGEVRAYAPLPPHRQRHGRG